MNTIPVSEQVIYGMSPLRHGKNLNLAAAAQPQSTLGAYDVLRIREVGFCPCQQFHAQRTPPQPTLVSLVIDLRLLHSTPGTPTFRIQKRD